MALVTAGLNAQQIPAPPSSMSASSASSQGPIAPAPLESKPAENPNANTSTLPLTLTAATSIALQQISALQQGLIDEAIAEGDLRQSQATILPRLRSSSTYTYNSPAHPHTNPSDPSFIAQNAVREYQELIGLTGELNFGLVAAVRRSRALLQAARAGTEVARRVLVRGVAESYYGAALARAKRRAAEQSLDAAREFERITELNYRAGEVPEVDLIRARLQTAARLDDALQARQAETISNASLGTLLGYDTNRTADIEALPQTIDVSGVPALPAAAAIARRPELRQLEAQARAAGTDVAVARAGRLPRLTFSIDEGFNTSSLSSQDLRKHLGILATANLDIPIWDWGLSRSRQHQAALRARGAELQLSLARRDLYFQYAAAQQEVSTAAQRVENARLSLQDAERNVTISIARYRAGEAPISEATDAQTTVANQRLALQQALYDYQVAQAHLREASGQ